MLRQEFRHWLGGTRYALHVVHLKKQTATLSQPPWRLLFETDYVFSDAQWTFAAKELIEEVRTNFTVLGSYLDRLVSLAKEQGKQEILRELLQSTQNMVVSVNFKRKRDEITESIPSRYRAARVSAPLSERIKFKTCIVETLKSYKSLI